jgi:putative hydrolase of the HAD superfamily
VFDLDNTLYPHHVNLWQQVDARIGEFVGAWLKYPRQRSAPIQKDYYRRYGTTMRGMMTEHGVHADDYLAYVPDRSVRRCSRTLRWVLPSQSFPDAS